MKLCTSTSRSHNRNSTQQELPPKGSKGELLELSTLLYMDNCNKWQKLQLQKLAKRMYRICFDLTRRYFGVSLFFTQKVAKFYRAQFGQTHFETSLE